MSNNTLTTILSMNNRFAWNFEINSDEPFTFPMNAIDAAMNANLHWETRFFWMDNEIIVVSGLEKSLLELSRYKIKHRTDHYYLLPDTDYNIKIRHDKLTYKPMLQRSKTAIAYGKKIMLVDCVLDNKAINEDENHVDPVKLLERIKTQGQLIKVDKEALIYTFQSDPSIKIEFARLRINRAIYFSLSVESASQRLVESLSQRMVGNAISCDYVTFLKNHTISS